MFVPLWILTVWSKTLACMCIQIGQSSDNSIRASSNQSVIFLKKIRYDEFGGNMNSSRISFNYFLSFLKPSNLIRQCRIAFFLLTVYCRLADAPRLALYSSVACGAACLSTFFHHCFGFRDGGQMGTVERAFPKPSQPFCGSGPGPWGH